MNEHIDCYCGQQSNYAQCCAPFHQGTATPRTAQALMRSRYSAYVVKNDAYLLATWHKTTRPPQIDFSQDHTHWIKLDIVKTKKGGVNDSRGVVEFNAFYQQDDNDKVERLHEISRFKKVEGQWFYVDGELMST